MERSDDGPSLNRDIALATWGLFVGLALLLLAAGLFGTLLGVRSELIKLPTAVSSLISASYYLGFLVGSRVALSALGRVGHIRVYAALASLAVGGDVGGRSHGVGTGLGLAAVRHRFVPCRSIRRRRIVAQQSGDQREPRTAAGDLCRCHFRRIRHRPAAAVRASTPGSITGFAIASIITSLAVAPVALSEDAVAPVIAIREHISLRDLAKLVPTGVVSCLLVGMAHGALTGMAAIYATRVGLSTGRIGLFVAAPNIGGMLLHWPVSAASDDIDRRAVGFVASVGAIGAAVLLLLGPSTSSMALLLIAILGGCSYPLYSIAAAYTNDWIEPEHVNAAASQLVTLYGLGAVIGPFVAAGMMIVVGPKGFFWAAIVLHSLLAAFFLYRTAGLARPAGEASVGRGVAAGAGRSSCRRRSSPWAAGTAASARPLKRIAAICCVEVRARHQRLAPFEAPDRICPEVLGRIAVDVLDHAPQRPQQVAQRLVRDHPATLLGRRIAAEVGAQQRLVLFGPRTRPRPTDRRGPTSDRCCRRTRSR